MRGACDSCVDKPVAEDLLGGTKRNESSTNSSPHVLIYEFMAFTMISRSILLVFLLWLLVVTSQFGQKQRIVTEAEANSMFSRRKQRLLGNEEAVKEKVILSQEKNIRQLNELVQSLHRQLLHCRGINYAMHDTGNTSSGNS